MTEKHPVVTGNLNEIFSKMVLFLRHIDNLKIKHNSKFFQAMLQRTLCLVKAPSNQLTIMEHNVCILNTNIHITHHVTLKENAQYH